MPKENKPILITGVGGFIGFSIAKELLLRGEKIIGIDNLNNYYDINLKVSRLEKINNLSEKNKYYWKFFKLSINNFSELKEIFHLYKPKVVINLAAQAGVRYSLKEPRSYIESNLIGFFNILENCKINEIENLIYASSSSVYGGNKNLPYKELNEVNHPISLYAATKKSNELMAHTYSHLYGLPATGLRFFTVYGPWGRPDMAPMIFSKAILEGESIEVFNFGKMIRDFTFIDDVVEVLCRCSNKPAEVNPDFDQFNPDLATSFAPHRIFNVGNSKPIKLMEFINLLENNLGKKAKKILKPLQDGDVMETTACTDLLYEWIQFKPSTKLEYGIKVFTDWYKNYFQLFKE